MLLAGHRDRDDLAAMVAQVRAVAPDVPIGVFAMIAVGEPADTGPIRDALGDGLYADFAGGADDVLAALHALADLGISRVQVTERLAGSIGRLGRVR